MPLVDESSLAALFIAALLGSGVGDEGVRVLPGGAEDFRLTALMTAKELDDGAMELAIVLPDLEVFSGILPSLPVAPAAPAAMAVPQKGDVMAGGARPQDASADAAAGASVSGTPVRTAVLSSSRGSTMTCQIRPLRRDGRLKASGEGVCVASDGRSLDVRF